MDPTRAQDLLKIKNDLQNPAVPPRLKRAARRAQRKIVEQTRDRQLVRLRERLALALNNNNKKEAWKITNIIKEYEGNGRWERFE